MQKFLSQLLPSFSHTLIALDGKTLLNVNDVSNIQINNLAFDSRDVTEGCLFFALPGTHVNGNNFIPDAIRNGANAIVYEGEIDESIQSECAKLIATRALNTLLSEQKKQLPVFIKVNNARFAMSPISDAFYDSPSKRLIVIGVTGTEGKSSTVSFIWQLLRLCGEKAGFISTVEYSLGLDALSNPHHQTTPEAPIIEKKLNEMLENGCKYAVIESSSHGLSVNTNRLGNIEFDCAVFMNVTHEHLEFHKTFEKYRSDKANLFRYLDKYDHIKKIEGTNIKVNSIGVVNLEDESAKYFIDSTKHNVFGFTTKGKAGKNAFDDKDISLIDIPSDIKYIVANNIISNESSLSFDIETTEKDATFSKTENDNHTCISINSKTPGAFNVYNIVSAIIAVSSVTNKSFSDIAKFVPKLVSIKGRMSAINCGQPFEVIVDYAHTPSSFETIFPSIKKRCKGKLFALFGSGGERDLEKRALQGEIAARFCDKIFLADEDPRGENPIELLNMIKTGAEKYGKKEGVDLFIIPDRPKAIRAAFNMAKENDIVLLLGKSHENSIIYKDYIMPYDEIAEAKKALAELCYNDK